MCKPSCCSKGASAAGPLAAIGAGLVVTAAVAGPVAAAAASLLHAVVLILIITVATLAGIAVLAVTVAIIRRTRRAPGHHPSIPAIARRQGAHSMPTTAPLALPRAAPRFELTEAERARCAALGLDPDQVAQMMAAVLGGLQ